MMRWIRCALPLLVVSLAAVPLSASAERDPGVASATSTGSKGLRQSVRSVMLRQAVLDAEGIRLITTDEESETEQPERDRLPQNPASPPASRMPATVSSLEPGTGAAFTAQTVGLSFTGSSLSGGPQWTSSIPPDPMGDVGPTQYVLFINGRLASFDKSTGIADGVLNVDPNLFFGPVRNGYRETDPRIRYDRFTARWFLVTINVSTPNRILFAVSDGVNGGTLTPASIFTFFYIDVATTPPALSSSCLADYPTLGIDRHALYIGTNNFCPGYAGSDGYVVRKSSLLGTGPLVVTAFRGLVASATGAGPFTPQGVDNLSPTSSEGYFIGSSNNSLGTLVLRRVSDPGGTPTISSNISITVPTTKTPILVEHLGNTGGTAGRLSTLDDRLFAAHLRDGRLWTAHHIGVNNTGTTSGTATRTGSRWYELNVPTGSGTPTVVQSGTVFTASASNTTDQPSWFYPAVMVSGQGHVAMSLTTAGAAAHANAGTAGRLLADGGGTMTAPALLTASATAYNPPGDPGSSRGRRWGDYSYVSLDPLDDMTMWSVNMFCDVSNSFGVRVTKLVPPLPATPAAIPDVTAGESGVTVTLTGNAVAGSGFYDPGQDLGGEAQPFRHLSASVTAGAATGTPPAVVSATYLDPVTVQLVLDASSATANDAGERYTVNVTNPDGQTSSAAILRVVPRGSTAVGPAGAFTSFGVSAVHPNPSRGAVEVDYVVPRAAAVRVSVVDLQGREVAVLVNSRVPAGHHHGAWSGATAGGPAPRGAYFVRLQAEGRTWAKRFVLVR
ncbi:MAG: T9SS type A sorting domain-containing protein [Candidatus Eisenbacteria bacterium]